MRRRLLGLLLLVGCDTGGLGLEGQWNRVDKPVTYVFHGDAYRLYEPLHAELGALELAGETLTLVGPCDAPPRTLRYRVDGNALTLDGATFQRSSNTIPLPDPIAVACP